MPQPRQFLLSPAYAGGKRASFLFNPKSNAEMAARLRDGAQVPLGELFAFLSGLYFRGKLAYARAFASPATAWVITPNRGLVPLEAGVTLDDLRSFGEVDIRSDDPRYREPLEKDVSELRRSIGDDGEVVLLGSIATGKYVDVLLGCFEQRLLFPIDFVGRGDMSRGGLLLRCAREGRELDYAPVASTVRHGQRPPKLAPVPRANAAHG